MKAIGPHPRSGIARIGQEVSGPDSVALSALGVTLGGMITVSIVLSSLGGLCQIGGIGLVVLEIKEDRQRAKRLFVKRPGKQRPRRACFCSVLLAGRGTDEPPMLYAFPGRTRRLPQDLDPGRTDVLRK
jgi:hypothetical protein